MGAFLSHISSHGREFRLTNGGMCHRPRITGLMNSETGIVPISNYAKLKLWASWPPPGIPDNHKLREGERLGSTPMLG